MVHRLTAFERLRDAVRDGNACVLSPQDAHTVLTYIHSKDEIVNRLQGTLKKYARELADMKGSPKPNVISISGGFDRNALRADIVRVWGEFGQHAELFDELTDAHGEGKKAGKHFPEGMNALLREVEHDRS